MHKHYVFGPVTSRRLGISLGVDPIRKHTCTLDCVYCEAGKTGELTCQRQEFAPLEVVQNELTAVLKDSPELDYITFSGTGEPTLYLHLTELACWIKKNYPQYRICLLTNGTLLNDPDVCSVLEYVDLAMPNFDASNDEELAVINRPAAGITVESLARGIRNAARRYPGKLALELFIVPGINDNSESIRRFAEYIKSFEGLHSVQLNTLDRPGVVDWIQPAPAETIRKFIAALEDIVPVEAVGRFRCRSKAFCKNLQFDDDDNRVLALVSRRPATAEDIALLLGLSVEKAREKAELLLKSGKVCAEKMPRGVFYSAV
ncbi:MAG: radical SAM protein [Lentisphaeria bacterium]|nr:radical SAM protein [Lentisphaerota bacterium]MBR7144914.1 radical SAM protein [Lentisphaeria bacterium]